MSAFPIHLVHRPPTHRDDRLWYRGLGYYFVDEAESLIGPYGTYDQARSERRVYFTKLNIQRTARA